MIASLCGLLMRAFLALQLFVTPQAAPPAPAKSKMNVVTFGVTHCTDGKNPLFGADRGAKQVADIFRSQSGTDVYSQVNEQVTCEAFMKKLDMLQERLERGECVVMYLACHGHIQDGEWCFKLHDGWITGRVLKEKLAGGAGKAYLFLDSCHSSALLDGSGPDIRGSGNLMVVASCRSNEVSWFCGLRGTIISWIEFDTSLGDSSQALIEALQGKADANGDGIVTLAEIEAYMAKRVAELNKQTLARLPEWRKQQFMREFNLEALTQTPMMNRPPSIDGSMGLIQLPKTVRDFGK